VTVNVAAVNDLPTVTATQTVAGTEDTAAKFTVAATDADGGTLTYTAAGAKSGTVTGGENGAFTYTPNANFNGTDTVTVTVKDAAGGTTTQTVTVNVAAVNDVPTVAATQNITVIEDTAFNGTVAATDVDGDTLTYSVTTASKAGAAVTIGNDGKFTYTPTTNFFGTDSFVVTANDGKGGTVSQTVNVTIADAPDVITVDKAGVNIDADNVDTTYNVVLGNYNYTITGFDAGTSATSGTTGGDVIVGPAGVPVSIDNSNTTDGRVVLTYASGGQVATITLDGLTTAQDAAIFGPNSFNTVFGAGAIA
jgi:VCBS repeat-containing protein